jgi:hypothetical protein
MDNTQYVKKLFDVIKKSPIPGVEKRMKHKICELKKFLIEQGCLNESNDSELLDDIACFSEVGYGMRKDISEPLVTTIKLDNGKFYDFSLSAFNSAVPYPFDVICIRRHEEDKDIVFIFDIAILIGGVINNVKVEYKSEQQPNFVKV